MSSRTNQLNLDQNTHLARIVDYLDKYRSISQWECYEAGMTTRLGARIFDLRKDYNQKIVSLPEIRKNQFGTPCCYSRYVYQEDYEKWQKENPDKKPREAAEYFQQLSQILRLQAKTTEELNVEILYHENQITRCQEILKQKEDTPKPPITVLRGRYAFLNNRYHSIFVVDGIIYPSAEIACIAYHTEDLKLRQEISKIVDPVEAKKRIPPDKLRPDWDDVKLEYVQKILRAKFNQNPALQKQLIATGNREIHPENLSHENFWGSCTCTRCKNLGQNMLGQLLMAERRFQTHGYERRQEGKRERKAKNFRGEYPIYGSSK